MVSISLALLGDVVSEGKDVVIGMLIVGLVIIGVIVLGELSGYYSHKRRSREPPVSSSSFVTVAQLRAVPATPRPFADMAAGRFDRPTPFGCQA